MTERADKTARSTARAPIARHAPGARRTPFAVLVLGLVVGGMCALLALNTAAAANEVQRGQIAGSDQSIAARVVQLRNQVAASAAPANLAAAAGRLGMVPAGDPAFVVLDGQGRARVLGSPGVVTGPPVAPPPTAPTSPAGGKKHQHTAAQGVGKAKKTTHHAASTHGTHGTQSRHTAGHHKQPPKTPPTTPPTTPTPTPNQTLPGGAR